MKNSLSFLPYTRVAMYILLCSIIFFTISPDEIFLKIMIVVVFIAFTISHYGQLATDANDKKIIYFVLIDFIAASVVGFLFPEFDRIYLIFFGVVSVTTFLVIRKKSVLLLFSFLFLFIWTMILIYKYIRFDEFEIAMNLLSVSFVVYGAVVGSLVQKLIFTKEKVTEQYKELTNSHAALKDAHQKLQAFSKQVEELTMIKERNRIAREIHDTVGHKMTALLVQLELSKELIAIDHDKAKVALENCDRLARNSLEEIRLSVQTIQAEDHKEIHLQNQLKNMLNEFAKMTNMEVSLSIEGDSNLIPSKLQPTIVRVVQEAITNAKRHGNATQCTVSLQCFKNKATIAIEDNGKGTAIVKPGFGLLNMKERISEHGGTIHFESVESKGFTINVEMPFLNFRGINLHD